MARGQLPPDGELRIGAVTLPAGHRIRASFGSGEPVAWLTGQEVTDTPRAWAMLSDAHEHTGLVPVLAGNRGAQGLRPWDDGGEFLAPADLAGLDRLEAAQVLASRWDRQLAGPEEEDPGLAADRAPFSRQFPGLAPRQDRELSIAERGRAIGSLQAEHLALVPASRPADVLPLIGWACTDQFEDALPITAVLRSWEDRFGAKLLQVGWAEIRLIVERPPRTRPEALAVAAEHVAFADECGGRGRTAVGAIATSLIDAPFWSLWWD
jgi:Domain of unknown function (DUF4253)